MVGVVWGGVGWLEAGIAATAKFADAALIHGQQAVGRTSGGEGRVDGGRELYCAWRRGGRMMEWLRMVATLAR